LSIWLVGWLHVPAFQCVAAQLVLLAYSKVVDQMFGLQWFVRLRSGTPGGFGEGLNKQYLGSRAKDWWIEYLDACYASQAALRVSDCKAEDATIQPTPQKYYP
jgi:hypothetical protein